MRLTTVSHVHIDNFLLDHLARELTTASTMVRIDLPFYLLVCNDCCDFLLLFSFGAMLPWILSVCDRHARATNINSTIPNAPERDTCRSRE